MSIAVGLWLVLALVGPLVRRVVARSCMEMVVVVVHSSLVGLSLKVVLGNWMANPVPLGVVVLVTVEVAVWVVVLVVRVVVGIWQ